MDELYKKYRNNSKEMRKIKRDQKAIGSRESSVKRTSKALGRKAGKVIKWLAPVIFLDDVIDDGVWQATKNAVNDALWPASELWN